MADLIPGHVLHTRTYDVKAVVVDDAHFRLIGRIHDVKPDGLWGVEDSVAMSVHDMTLEMVVRVHDLTITDAVAAMNTHPHMQCKTIVPAYEQLIGLSIARGFTQKVKELFGGPRACTHIGALINAMAPVAMQCVWAFMQAKQPAVSGSEAVSGEDARREHMTVAAARNRNTCHVWADAGPMLALLSSGGDLPAPLWAIERLGELGLDLADWRSNAV